MGGGEALILLLSVCTLSALVGCNPSTDSGVVVIESVGIKHTFSNFNKAERSVVFSYSVDGHRYEFTFQFNEAFTQMRTLKRVIDGQTQPLGGSQSWNSTDGFVVDLSSVIAKLRS